MTDLGKLKVGRASAGSGKTFTLTIEYISLLIMNPENYRYILAVTFTNKATNEMKHRIIDTLHLLGQGDKSANAYLSKLMEKSGKSAEVIRQRCAQALTLILHDYSRFRIETIDSFFQSIIRDLARELNLTANLKVDLDSDEALENAVGRMIEDMKVGDGVYNTVLSYVQDNLNEQNKNWKIDTEVIQFSKNIYNENYLKEEKAISERTSEPGFYAKYKTMLYTKLDGLGQDSKTNAMEFNSYIKKQGFNSTYFVNGKSGVFSFFPKIAEGKNPKIPAAIEKNSGASWMTDKSLDDQHSSFYRKLMAKELLIRKKKATIKAVLKHLNQMSLLGSVDKTLRQLNRENNRFILADTAHELNEIISDNDIPFIYEKASSSFKYIMIDEFQDTSELQWQNFIPLLKECIDSGHVCIIVGDVKQSIYRWRNSDWGILNNINADQNFSGAINEAEMTKALDTNHRSDEHIVTFNNKFFAKAKETVATHYSETFGNEDLTDDIRRAYSSVEQKVDDRYKGQGFVDIIDITKDESEQQAQVASKQAAKASDEQTFDELMLEELGSTLQDLIYKKKVKESDIAILTRSNRELKLVSAYVKQHLPKLRIVSDEAFQLDSSEAVNILILAIQVVTGYNPKEYKQEQKPLNMFLCATLAYRYQSMIAGNPLIISNLEQCMQAQVEELERMLPKQFFKDIAEMQTLPVYELCEHLFSQFQLYRLAGQSAYLFYFMDEVSAFSRDNSANISSFLDYWNDKLHSKTIPSISSDGIQLMTIHKSKGLEFHTVIVPFCNWEMGGNGTIIWCKSNDINRLPLTPIYFNKELENTDFKEEYEVEELKNYVDNLNLIYVAFTRAAHNLIVLTGHKVNRYSVYDVIKSVTKESLLVPSGQIMASDLKKGNSTDTDSDIIVKFVNTELIPEFKQSNKSKEFVDDEDDTDNNRATYIKKGLVVHKVFEMIKNEDDIPQALRTLEQDGVMQDKIFYEDIKKFVIDALKDNRVRDWFAPKWNVMNECDFIMDENGMAKTNRPDRVIYDDHETIVIDYKTGKALSSHKKQVQNYMHQLKLMGMPNVHGYLWYMKENKIQPIETA